MNQETVDTADQLANRLNEDVQLARTRDEHIRVTARANEARNLADMLKELLIN